MSLSNQQRAFLLDVAKLLVKADELHFAPTAGELFRPQEMQAIYFKQGKTKTLSSNHTRRLAIDLNLFVGDRLATAKEIEPLGTYWESLSSLNRWGGNFTTITDGPHFERNAP